MKGKGKGQKPGRQVGTITGIKLQSHVSGHVIQGVLGTQCLRKGKGREEMRREGKGREGKGREGKVTLYKVS